MKVLVISHSSVVSAYREKLKLLCRRSDVELTLLLPSFWPEAGQRVCSRDAQGENYTIVSSPILFEGKPGWYFYPLLSRIVRAFKPDIIHIEEEPYSMAAWQAVKLAKKVGSKVVFFTWENLQESFRFPQNKARQSVLGRADYAIAGNQKAAQMLQQAGIGKNKISILPQYGVNPEIFKKKNAAKLKKQLGLSFPTIGYVGRLVEEKGIQLLLEAVARMKKKANLLLIGNGPVKQKLQEQALRLGIEKRVFFISAIGNAEVSDYLNSMGALVLPSLTTAGWKEQFGRVLIEAQACEVPVIGSSSGAIPEVIGKAGLIFQEGNTAALTAKLDLVTGSASLRREVGKAGRKKVLEQFTNQRLADGIYRIYKKIL